MRQEITIRAQILFSIQWKAMKSCALGKSTPLQCVRLWKPSGGRKCRKQSELEITVSRGRKKVQDTDYRIRFNGIF